MNIEERAKYLRRRIANISRKSEIWKSEREKIKHRIIEIDKILKRRRYDVYRKLYKDVFAGETNTRSVEAKTV